MIRNRVRFTGLEIDPRHFIEPRWSRGVIPLDWHRTRFPVPPDVTYPISKLNRWLNDNIEGRWTAYVHLVSDEREIVIAFQYDYDAVTFALASGKTEAFQE